MQMHSHLRLILCPSLKLSCLTWIFYWFAMSGFTSTLYEGFSFWKIAAYPRKSTCTILHEILIETYVV